MQECAGRLLREDCPAYRDGKKALYILKLMLMKMAHKDWTPIDRQKITSQAKRPRAQMAAVCHFGCEGTVADSQLRATATLVTAAGNAEVEEIQETQKQIVCDVQIQPAWIPLIREAQEHLATDGECEALHLEVVESTDGVTAFHCLHHIQVHYVNSTSEPQVT